MTRRIAIFASVSSPQQAAIDKDSLPSQERDGRAWAESVGGDVVAVYRVPGHSRKYIFFPDAEKAMGAYRQLREDAEAQKFDVLWCRARDRLGRTDALISQVEAICANAGASVYSAAMPSQLDDASKASGIYLSAVERAQAQVENEVRVQRHRMGMRARARRGLHPSIWPYGYRAIRDDNGKCLGAEFEPSEIGAVRLITDLYLQGIGYKRIAEAVRAAGYRTRPDARLWWPSKIRKMVGNDLYAGILRYDDLVIESDKFPPAWDGDTYAEVLRERQHRHRGGQRRVLPVSGIVICARCGRRMTADRYDHNREIIYYRCGTRKRRRVTGEDCHANTIKAAVVMQAVELTFSAFTSREEILRNLEDESGKAEALRAELERITAAIADIGERRRRLALLVETGAMLADVYRERDDALVTELDTAATHRSAIASELLHLPDLSEQADAVWEIAQRPPGWLADTDPEQGYATLHAAGLRVLVENSTILRIDFRG